MNRQKIWSLALMIASAASVMFSVMPGSVTVFDTQAQTTAFYSFFEQIPNVGVGMFILLAGICSGLCLMLSVADLIVHKEGVRTGMMMLSMASATLAVLPLLADRSTVVLPNMLHPLLMGAVFVGTYLLRKLKK